MQLSVIFKLIKEVDKNLSDNRPLAMDALIM